MAKIVTLGEIMLRLSPQGNDRFIQSESFRIIPGGGEANVAISVANYGCTASLWCQHPVYCTWW